MGQTIDWRWTVITIFVHIENQWVWCIKSACEFNANLLLKDKRKRGENPDFLTSSQFLLKTTAEVGGKSDWAKTRYKWVMMKWKTRQGLKK